MTGQPDMQKQGSLLIVALYRRFVSSSEGKRALTRLINATVRDECLLGLLHLHALPPSCSWMLVHCYACGAKAKLLCIADARSCDGILPSWWPAPHFAAVLAAQRGAATA